MTADTKQLETWAILELMGHRRLAGYVQEVEVAGAGMLRLDVPEHPWNDGCTCGSDEPASIDHEKHTHVCYMFRGGDEPLDVRATQFYSPAAVYCLTPTSEEIARTLSKPPAPAARWELERPAIPQHVPTREDFDPDIDPVLDDDDPDVRDTPTLQQEDLEEMGEDLPF